MGIALAISIPVAVLLLILLILGFSYDFVGQKQKHERQVLALEKGLPVPPEPVTVGPRSKVLLWIAVVVPPYYRHRLHRGRLDRLCHRQHYCRHRGGSKLHHRGKAESSGAHETTRKS